MSKDSLKDDIDKNPKATSPKTGLKLRAEESEDVVIFSTVLQDAVTTADDIAYVAAERRFALMLNRYVWESEAEDAPSSAGARQRIRCGLHFDGVLAVRSRDISQKSKKLPLELLAIHSEVAEDGSGALYFLFAGGGALKLEVECIDGYLSDVGEPWMCKHRPHHEP